MNRRQLLAAAGGFTALCITGFKAAPASASQVAATQYSPHELYMAGSPVVGALIILDTGVRWTPVVQRMWNGYSWFAGFTTPDGVRWLGSEDDGTLWRQHPDGSWTLATAQDVDERAQALAALITLMIKIAVFLVWSFHIITLLVFILMIIKGHYEDRRSKKTQLDIRVWAGDMQGATELYAEDPRFRTDLYRLHPQLPQLGAEHGWWLLP